MSGEKTEKPTAQRLKKARREGQFGKSQDVGAWAGIMISSILLPMSLTNALGKSRELIGQIPAVIAHPEATTALSMMKTALFGAATSVAPLVVTIMLVGIAASGAQGGIRVATKLFVPKFSRLNPLPGFKKMFGPHAAWEATKALVKTGVLGAVLYMTVKNLVPMLAAAGELSLAALLGIVRDTVLSLIRSAAAVGLVMAAADYLVIRRRTMKSLKMSKEEVKQEHKNQEGDPHVKGQIRSRQMAMARNRQMADVPKADVVMVNPTHVAVALRYDPAKGAPRVLAKGSGAVATKIRELATEHRIPMVQDIPLARALHASCEIGQEIPPAFYAAVAKVLAFVMSLKAKGSAAGVHRNPNPTPVPEAA